MALRPAKGSAAEPALASGVVYRIREDAMTVALEEAPEQALDQPLRLDKLANEARLYILCGLVRLCENCCKMVCI